jgi:hypothetical protein
MNGFNKLVCLHDDRLQKLARHKHSSLLDLWISWEGNKFYKSKTDKKETCCQNEKKVERKKNERMKLYTLFGRPVAFCKQTCFTNDQNPLNGKIKWSFKAPVHTMGKIALNPQLVLKNTEKMFFSDTDMRQWQSLLTLPWHPRQNRNDHISIMPSKVAKQVQSRVDVVGIIANKCHQCKWASNKH